MLFLSFAKAQGLRARLYALILGLALLGILVDFANSAAASGAPTFSAESRSRSDGLTVYVVNYPLKYFAERIAGDHATVVLPVPGNVNPAVWIPDANTVIAYQRADLTLLNGAGYAKWIDKVTLRNSRLIDTSASFKESYIKIATVTHAHGPEGKHSHAGTAATTWLDFLLAVKQARTIAEALGRKTPALRDTFQSNFVALEKDLMAIDQDIKEIASKNPQQALLTSSTVYDYLARRYELRIRSVQWKPEEMPDWEQWAELQGILTEHPAKWMMWERDPIPATIARLKSLGINNFVFVPAGNAPQEGDFLSIMRQNVKNLTRAFQ